MAIWLLVIIISFTGTDTKAQCPANIGFESGTLAHWDCALGFIDKDGKITLTKGSDTNRQKIIKDTGIAYDPFGGFPVNCPNGSGYSLRLGDSVNNSQAESVSYTFTIPANRTYYSIIYNYAVVLQNPDHEPFEQPKFTAKVYDVTAGAYIDCSTFEYTAHINLPGFSFSPVKQDVLFKPWTPVTIKLTGYAGKTIRLEFTTNDCTKTGHFGYAYLDVDDDCSSPIKGSVSCPNDNGMNMIAPYGFSGYRWFPIDFSSVLGSGTSLKFDTVPPEGTGYAVELTPFPNQGCLDTVYTFVRYSNDTVKLKLPADPVTACASVGVNITDPFVTAGSAGGDLLFTYFTDAALKLHLFSPDSLSVSGTYYIKAVNEDGCFATGAVKTKVEPMPVFSIKQNIAMVTIPNTVNLSSVIISDPGIRFSFWKDAAATVPLPNPDAIGKAGTYYVKGTNVAGCYIVLPVTLTFGDPPVSLSNIFSPNGDGINDEWANPVLTYYPDCTIQVYTRTGQEVFRSAGYKTWNGKYNGQDLPIGTYYYLVKLGKGKTTVSGSISIIR